MADILIELQNRRKKKNLTCKDMAEKLNVSKPFYWQIEHCKRRLSYAMAVKLSDILGTKPDKLFYEEFKNKEN